MEFEADKYNECVAYLTNDGFLIIRDLDDSVAVALSKIGVGINPDWKPGDAVRRFYPGDEVKITF